MGVPEDFSFNINSLNDQIESYNAYLDIDIKTITYAENKDNSDS